MSTIVVTGAYQQAPGVPSVGAVSFTLRPGEETFSVQLAEDGTFSITLTRNDDPSLPAGSSYRVDERIDGVTRPSYWITLTNALTSPVSIHDLAPSSSPGAITETFTGPQGPPGPEGPQGPAGDVTGTGTFNVDDWVNVASVSPLVLKRADAPSGGGGGGGFYTPNPAGMGSGRWIAPVDLAGRGTSGPPAGYAIFAPYLLAADLAISQVGVETTTAVAGAVHRLGAYSSNALGEPSALIADFGTVAADTVGNKFMLASATLPAGLVWLTLVNQGGSPAVRVGSSAYIPHHGMTDGNHLLGSLSTRQASFYGGGGTITGALPATMTGVTNDQAFPVIVMKLA